MQVLLFMHVPSFLKSAQFWPQVVEEKLYNEFRDVPPRRQHLDSIDRLGRPKIRLQMSDPTMRCSMTGIPIRDSGDGIWDEGEWISWAYINQQLAEQEEVDVHGEEVDSLQAESPEVRQAISEAEDDEENSTHASPIWGKVGELFMAERFNVVLSRSHAQGHDGRLGNHLVEIKTISPGKGRPFVRVKRAGNFSLLAVVKIDPQHRFEVRFVPRENLPAHEKGLRATIAWSTACRLGTSRPPV